MPQLAPLVLGTSLKSRSEIENCYHFFPTSHRFYMLERTLFIVRRRLLAINQAWLTGRKTRQKSKPTAGGHVPPWPLAGSATVSIKNCERARRSRYGCFRTTILRSDQPIPRQWNKYLSNGDNKVELAVFLCKEWQKPKYAVPLFNRHFFATAGNMCWCLTTATMGNP